MTSSMQLNKKSRKQENKQAIENESQELCESGLFT